MIFDRACVRVEGIVKSELAELMTAIVSFVFLGRCASGN